MKDLGSELLAEGLRFPEGPRWHDEKLWLSDMYGEWVVTVTTSGVVEEQVRVDVPGAGIP